MVLLGLLFFTNFTWRKTLTQCNVNKYGGKVHVWKSRNFYSFLSSKVVQGSFNILMIFFLFNSLPITKFLPEWSSKIKSSRKINYFSTLKTRWTIWRLPQVEFENQVENPLGISMPLFLLSCFWSVWSFNCRKIYSADSALFALLDKHTAIQVKAIVEFPKQNKWLLVIWVSAVCFKNCAKLGNPLEKKCV